MFNASLNIAWSIAEIEASAAGFESILPGHFWIGCCKGCDLDYAKFLQNATAKIRSLSKGSVLNGTKLRPVWDVGRPSRLPAFRGKSRRDACSTPVNLVPFGSVLAY
jgi:hypothetical protein